MNKTLLVPDHIMEKRAKEKEGVLSNAYVKEAERFLEPSKLPQKTIDRLPQPTGWRILILPYRGKPKTDSGIHIPDQVQERESLATVCGYVLRVGSDAYKDTEKFSEGSWCKEGDWVIFGRYAGSRFRIEGGEVRILNDDEIIATINDPSDILHI
jgi:co-chaperonin GroES (HSP10)|tara:strand:- start:5990 stop:6454 length:465 start_codon:yes stop_codon:yes gene_type:complete